MQSPPKTNKRSALLKTLLTAERTLLTLANGFEWALTRHGFIDFADYQELKDKQSSKAQKRYLFYLKRQKLVEIKNLGEKLMVRLTENGWAKALHKKIKLTKTKCPNGKCYFILFDIPETERMARNRLRKFLKECGFKKIQHSVWMTNLEILKPLQQLFQRHNFEQWIRIISGNIIPSSQIDKLKLRKYYH